MNEEITKLVRNMFNEFSLDIRRDNPTDAYSLANKRYVDTGGPAETMTYAATITLQVGMPRLHITTTTAAVGNSTINASLGGMKGQILQILITNDATANRTITFGTNFLPNATLVGTTSKSAIVSFVSNGTAFYEFARQTGL